ncbi:MAG: YlxR family protein [Actinobacteria bacterium]|nr:MAG: YlxR family protein [Actinomycetota bacterium]
MGVDSATPSRPRFPVRTCIGCRRRAAKDDLLRVVRVGTELVADPRAVLPGRGAYLHRDAACLDLAVRRRAFARALGLRGEAELSAVAAAARQASGSIQAAEPSREHRMSTR